MNINRRGGFLKIGGGITLLNIEDILFSEVTKKYDLFIIGFGV